MANKLNPTVRLYLSDSNIPKRYIRVEEMATLYGMDKMMNGELLDEFATALKRWRIQKEIEELANNHLG